MTNLDIIKHLAYENPSRLAELLEDIYCLAWNDGANDKLGDESSIRILQNWLYEDAAKCGLYYHHELEKWDKTIKNPSIEITYPDNLVVQLPFEGKDPNHMWNTDNNYNIINNAIDEIELLENLAKTDKYDDSIYENFRKEVCSDCRNRWQCLQSKMAIVECSRFACYMKYKEN